MASAIHLNEAQADSKANATDQADAGQLALLWSRVGPHVELAARLASRHLVGDPREDFIQECRALAIKWLARLVVRGKDPLQFRAVFCQYLTRAVACGRTAAPRGRVGCPLDTRTQRVHGVSVESLPADAGGNLSAGLGCGRLRLRQDDWQGALGRHCRATPADQAAFRIDFRRWLRRLSPRNRRAIRLLIRGERKQNVALAVEVSPARISQLQREWCENWRRFHGEPV